MKWSLLCVSLVGGACVCSSSQLLASDGGMGPEATSISSTVIGEWRVEKIESRRVRGGRKLAIRINPDGEVSGYGGCNGFSSKAAISGDKITFSPVITTWLACEADIVRQEQHLRWALENASSWTFDDVRGVLELRGKQGGSLLTSVRR